MFEKLKKIFYLMIAVCMISNMVLPIQVNAKEALSGTETKEVQKQKATESTEVKDQRTIESKAVEDKKRTEKNNTELNEKKQTIKETGKANIVAESISSNPVGASSANGLVIVNNVVTKYNGTATDVIIPNGVTGIGDKAFRKCTSLKTITIPSTVTSIGKAAFRDCSSLSSIAIPDSVKRIGESAFQDCSNLQSITLSNNITIIERWLFSGCSQLKNVIIPKGITMIKQSAFWNCTSLTEVTIPDGVTTIEYQTFMGCSSLRSITIPNGITSIESYAFVDCSNLKSIRLPKSISVIGMDAFSNCTSLTKINIPSKVMEIEEGSFFNCNSLECITVDKNNKKYSSSDGVLYNKAKTTILKCPSKKAGEYSICSSVTQIEDYAFYNCSSLTTINIPAGVTNIGFYAFEYCSNLKNIIIPQGVHVIPDGTFAACTSLTSITIPRNVDCVLDYALTGCSNLRSVIVLSGKTDISYAFTDSDKPTIYATRYSRAIIEAISQKIPFVCTEGIPVSNLNISLSNTNYVYDGKSKKPAVVVKYGSDTLKQGMDYTVSYAANKKTGVANVIVTGAGDFAGNVTLNFIIKPKQVTANVEGLKKAAKVSWGKVKGSTGYTVYMSTSQKGSYKKVGMTESDVTSYKQMKLKSGKTYYFKVRAFAQSGESIVNGVTSEIKSVKVK